MENDEGPLLEEICGTSEHDKEQRNVRKCALLGTSTSLTVDGSARLVVMGVESDDDFTTAFLTFKHPLRMCKMCRHEERYRLVDLLAVRTGANRHDSYSVQLKKGAPKLRKHQFGKKNLLPDGSINYSGKALDYDVSMSKNPQESYALYLYFVVKHRSKPLKVRLKRLVLQFEDGALRRQWEAELTTIISGYGRPCRLLVYANPVGGKKKAMEFYNKTVGPLFELANISVVFRKTERQSYAYDDIVATGSDALERDYDGVVAIGGDGLFNEVFGALVVDQQKCAGVDLATLSSKLTLCTLPIGLIAAGSANSTVLTLQNSTDVLTSAIQIALGYTRQMDICSLHEDNGNLLRFACGIVGYSVLGDLIRDSEHFRRLGPFRYFVSGVRVWLRSPSYKGTVGFRPANERRYGVAAVACNHKLDPNGADCDHDCATCSNTEPDENDALPSLSPQSCHADGRPNYPRHVYAEWSHIIACVTPCVSPFTPDALAPNSQLDCGTIDLVLVRRWGRRHNLWMAWRIARRGGRALAEDMLVERVRGFCFSPTDVLENDSNGSTNALQIHRRGMWNIDGELVAQPPGLLHFRIHQKLVTVFALPSSWLNSSNTHS